MNQEDNIYNLLKSVDWHQIIVKKSTWTNATAKVYRINFKYAPIRISGYISNRYVDLPFGNDYTIVHVLSGYVDKINYKKNY